MPLTTLKTIPIEMDAGAIAGGLLEEFTDDELAALRFGMLPARVMDCFAREFEQHVREKFPHSGDSDTLAAWLTVKDGKSRVIEFRMRELVNEACHLLTLAFYDRGDLVV